MLENYRVIDLSDERGLLCSSILADLGAEVVHVEPPGGSAARTAAPAGALWEAWARNSLSVTIDMASAEDLQRLRDLVRTADFLIESGEPGWLERYGLDYASVETLNPAIVYVSITPFGSSGPRAADPATDLTVQAASGLLFTVGSPERPPLRIPGNHSWAHAGAEAAGAALIAHHARRRSGLGQHVDISAQEATALAAMGSSFAHELKATPITRTGDMLSLGKAATPTIYPAADGFVVLMFTFGPSWGPYARRLMEWIYEEGECDEQTRDKDWIGYLDLIRSGAEPLSELDRLVEIVSRFCAKRPAQQLFDEARARKIMMAPVNSFAQVLEDEQLRHREFFWRATDLPDAPPVPGAFAKFSRTPLEYRRRAPAPGEDTGLVTTSGRSPVAWGGDPVPERALDDVKVLDFSWLMAAPWATRVLADHGATVVKVEGQKRPDPGRMSPPFRNDEVRDSNSALFHTNTAGKLSMALDLSTEEGKEVVRDLVKWADVVIESYSPKAMRNWGLDYAQLTKIKPDLIMLSSSLFGQTGPYAMLPGLGTMGSAMSGITATIGWPGEKVIGPPGAYTDVTAPRLGLIAVLAALDHRKSTGEGQYIDFAQVESGVSWIGPELLDFVLNGHQFAALGNSNPTMAPHGVYPSQGQEKWVALAVRDDRDWLACCRTIGRDDLADDPRYRDVAARLANAADLDEVITAWTQGRSAQEAERLLVAQGVPAAAILDPADFAAEPQFRHRGHITSALEFNPDGVPFQSTHAILSRTPAQTRWGGPPLGQHTDAVLRSILGYEEQRIAELRAAGVTAG